MNLPKLQKIEIAGNPLALIVGESEITSYLSQKLSQGGCEVVEAKDFPKSGKFNYIFQFGNVEKVKDSYIKFLKPSGKFLFIDYKNEDINTLLHLKDIKILRVENLSPWYFQKLSDEILKITFTPYSKNIIDIRLNEDKKSLSVTTSRLKNIHAAESERKVTPAKITSGIVQKKIGKPVAFLLGLVLLLCIGAGSALYWQAKSISAYISSSQNHLESGDLEGLNNDLVKLGKIIKTAGNLYNLIEAPLSPFKNVESVKQAGEFLDSLEKFNTSAKLTSSLLLGIQKEKNTSNALDFSLSNLKYEELTDSVFNLTSSAKNLRTRAAFISPPFFSNKTFINLLDKAIVDLDSLSVVMPAFKNILYGVQKEYLLLFQNNMELRPTGGFIGSVGFLNINNGKTQDFQIMDVYSIDGQLKGHVNPPDEIRKHFNQPNWFLRDSNFDPDFAISARQAQFFLDKSIGKKVDGVIGINLFLVQDLLDVIGPITLSDFNNEVITSDNFFIKAQLFINKNFFPGSSQKKDFLANVSSEIQKKLVEKNFSFLKVFQVLRKSLEEKNLLFYFNENPLQKEFENLGWGGRIINTRCLDITKSCLADYLGLFESNFGVNKANFFVNKTVSVDKKINTNGQVITDLVTGYQNQSQSGLLEGGEYANYLRLFIPKNSTFISASFNDQKIDLNQFDVSPYQSDKIVYGILLKVPENSNRVFKFSYSLNDSININTQGYEFYFQKQPGDKVSALNLSYASSLYKLIPVNFQPSSDGSLTHAYATETSVDRIFQFKFSL